MSHVFVEAKGKDDLKRIINHTLGAFSDSPDFDWTVEDLNKELKEGWKCFSLQTSKGEVIAALLYKVDSDELLTKNTSVRMEFQGSGYSHKIKDFFETKAKESKISKIVHFCRIDNFRMYSLNESHGYQKTPRKLGPQGHLVEWVKSV